MLGLNPSYKTSLAGAWDKIKPFMRSEFSSLRPVATEHVFRGHRRSIVSCETSLAGLISNVDPSCETSLAGAVSVVQPFMRNEFSRDPRSCLAGHLIC